MENRFALLSSPSMYELGNQLIEALKECGANIPHYQIDFTVFANGEVLPKIPHTIRGQHVFFLHGFQDPDPNTAIMMMLTAHDAIRRASASGITLVAPYLSYLRQDRKDQPRVPISARLLADLIELHSFVKGVITIDMHAEQEQGFFSIPVDNLSGVHVFMQHICEKFKSNMNNVVMLAPDFGGAVRNRRLALKLGVPVCILEKRRTGPNKAEIMSIIGEDVKGKNVVIYEDMICSGGTALKVVEKVLELEASSVHFCATHGIFSKNADARFAEKNISVACTDSIPRNAEYYQKHASWLTPVSIVPYFAKAMHEAMQFGGSISNLYEEKERRA